MARISLRETYDNRSVIAQIAKVTDTAEDAAETVQQKAAEINDALTDVNAAVQAAEGAVTTANAASAAAQQSAQTVAGYENRLATVESDLNAVTLRVTTAEGQIVTIQGRVTALETADGQNVKLSGDQAITGIKTVPLEATGTFSSQIASSNKVKNELDNYTPMMRTTGNQNISGIKTFITRPLKVYALGSGGESDVSIHIGDNRTDADHTIGTQTGQFTLGKIGFFDGSGNWGGSLYVQITNDGKSQLMVLLRNADGTRKTIPLATGD